MPRRDDGLKQGTWFGIPADTERPPLFREETFFEGQSLRIIYVKGVPWFVLADLARILGYRDAEKAGRILRPKHKGTLLVGTLGGTQEMLSVNKTGLYRLMMRSDRPEAERFQDWITEDVLPSIDRSGSYTMPMARVNRMARKLHCSHETALARNKNVDINKAIHSCLASRKANRNHYKSVHNKLTESQFGPGRDVPALRKEIGLRSRATPLDHFEEIPLAINNLMKAVGLKAIQDEADAGRPVPIDEIPAFLAARGRECAVANLSIFGEGASYGRKDHPLRGAVYDIVRGQLTTD